MIAAMIGNPVVFLCSFIFENVANNFVRAEWTEWIYKPVVRAVDGASQRVFRGWDSDCCVWIAAQFL